MQSQQIPNASISPQATMPNSLPTNIAPVDDPLAQLKDIHAPSDVNAWPLDWGWWALGAIIIGILYCLTRWVLNHIRFNKPRKQALALLEEIKPTDDDWPLALNGLLKRTALTYYDPQRVCALHGNAWYAFLLEKSSKAHDDIAQGFDLLAKNAYRKTPSESDFKRCSQAVKLWLLNARFEKAGKEAEKASSSSDTMEATNA